MNVEDFRDFCLSLPKAQENAPWTEPEYQNLITFTVADKWFCLLDIENKFCNVKCAPQEVLELQEKYSGAQPAWHMNKTHWIKIVLDSDVPDSVIKQVLTQGHNLIVKSLSKAKRQDLGL